MEMQSFEFQNLSFAYDNDVILDDCDFTFPTNGVTLISGDEGCGKSTLLKLLASLSSPTGGKYIINNQEITEMTFEEFLPYRLQIGYSMDMGGLLSNKTILENLLLPLQYHKAADVDDWLPWLEKIMKDFLLENSKNLRPSMLTGAVRKMSCIGRVFVLKPEMLLLDNPTEGVASHYSDVVKKYIIEGLNDGWLKHVFLTSHDKEFVNSVCTQKIKIENKKINLTSFKKLEKEVRR